MEPATAGGVCEAPHLPLLEHGGPQHPRRRPGPRPRPPQLPRPPVARPRPQVEAQEGAEQQARHGGHVTTRGT